VASSATPPLTEVAAGVLVDAVAANLIQQTVNCGDGVSRKVTVVGWDVFFVS